jgi:transposase InsO family protein
MGIFAHVESSGRRKVMSEAVFKRSLGIALSAARPPTTRYLGRAMDASSRRNCAARLAQELGTTATRMTAASRSRDAYLATLGGLFALFNSARVVAYLPTIWAVAARGDSSQHSLWTWLCFLGGNATMALWLWEQNGRTTNRAIVVSACNALMCTGIVGVIAWTRL